MSARFSVRTVAAVLTTFLAGCTAQQAATETQTAASGDWLNRLSPGIPRTADGKPDLTGPIARTADGKPDLSGIWRPRGGGYMVSATSDLKPEEFHPQAAQLMQQRVGNEKDAPTVRCLPLGPLFMYTEGIYTFKLVQTPTLILTLHEHQNFRQIFMDGRSLPENPNPTWMGWSVGRWDRDTLVVDSTGYKEQVWLDFMGSPISESMRITERFHRRDFGHMDLEITFNDPKNYTRPWTIQTELEIFPDTELLEWICNENEKDRTHITGPSEMRPVQVSRDILSSYVGVYETPNPEDPKTKLFVTVALPGDNLTITLGTRGQVPALPLSETTFFGGLGGTVEFVKDPAGAVNQLVMRIAEGDLTFVRQK